VCDAADEQTDAWFSGAVLPSIGRQPLKASYRVTPNAQISTRWSHSEGCSACSGAMYASRAEEGTKRGNRWFVRCQAAVRSFWPRRNPTAASWLERGGAKAVR